MIKEIALTIPGADGPIPIDPAVVGMPGGQVNPLQVIVTWGLGLVFAFAGVAALFFLIWGGISWITSGGEKEKIEEARKKIVYAIIGLVVILASFFIINTVGALFGIAPFNLVTGVQCNGDPNNLGCYNYICNPKTHQWECTGGH
jgi:amino acid transporter